MYKILAIVVAMMASVINVFAQAGEKVDGFVSSSVTTKAASQSVEMADALRSDGKIWVVVAVVGIILIGFIVYLFTVDSKLSKLEGRITDLKSK
ncbi:MAG: hypothetical protein RLZZ175_2365 [Bacteroidota bacterium]|jgi:methylmalonyl-CoA mutase cobalamin-binding subunit